MKPMRSVAHWVCVCSVIKSSLYEANNRFWIVLLFILDVFLSYNSCVSDQSLIDIQKFSIMKLNFWLPIQ